MQMKKQLTDRRSAKQLLADAHECHDAGFQCIADILWDEAKLMERREERRRREAEGVDEEEDDRE